MRKKRRSISTPSVSPKAYKISFIVAAAILVLAMVLYAVGQILIVFTPETKVFASPYSRQNMFVDIDKKLQDKGFEVKSKQLSANKSYLTIELQDGPKVIFTNDSDIDWQISSLHSIVYKLTIENKSPKQVDFRFEKPIVKF